MDGTFWVALLSLLGTLIGTLGGIFVSSKLTNYRIEQLEKRVEDLGSVAKDQIKLAGKVEELQREVEELKGYHKPH